MPRIRFLAGVLVAVLIGGTGCSGSSSDGEPHQVKDLKSRGMRDNPKDGGGKPGGVGQPGK